MKKFLVVTLGGVLAGSLALTAVAQTNALQQQVDTAHVHALMAQGATTVDMAHAHLQHVVNCLVGPKGAGFDAKAANPCKGQGNGAIPDAAHDHAMHGKLEQALVTAQAGLKATQLDAIHGDAAKLATALQKDAAATPPASAPASKW